MFTARCTLLTVVLLFGTATTARAQSDEASIHDRSSPVTNARYEIVQSTFAARFTFMVDRFIGRVFQLQTKPDSTYKWRAIPAARRQYHSHARERR